MHRSNREAFRQAMQKEAFLDRVSPARQARWDKIVNAPVEVTRNVNPASQAAGQKAIAAAKARHAAPAAAPAAPAAPKPVAAPAPKPAGAGKVVAKGGGGAAAKGARLGATAGRVGAGLALGTGAYMLGKKLLSKPQQPKMAQALQARIFHSMATAPDREKLAQVLLEGEEAAGEVLRRCSI